MNIGSDPRLDRSGRSAFLEPIQTDRLALISMVDCRGWSWTVEIGVRPRIVKRAYWRCVLVLDLANTSVTWAFSVRVDALETVTKRLVPEHNFQAADPTRQTPTPFGRFPNDHHIGCLTFFLD